MIIWVRYDDDQYTLSNVSCCVEVVVLDLFRWYGLLGGADDACSAAAAAADEVRRMSVMVMMLGREMLSLVEKKK